MTVILAVTGSRRLGEPQRHVNEIYPTATLYPTYNNVAQMNLLFRELNAIVRRITELEQELDPEFNPHRDLELSIGDADGADELARIWAVKNQLNYKCYVAKWKLYGKSAGHRRNPDIISPAKYVVSFWDGESKGTKGGIDYAKKHNKKLKVIKYLKKVPYLNRKRSTT